MKVLLAVLVVVPCCLCVFEDFSIPELEGIISKLKSKNGVGLKDLVSSIRPNKKVLACPVPQTFFPTNRTEPECTTDRDCRRQGGEMCCQWFQNKYCLKGLDTTPRDGQCPKITMFNDACIADAVSCRYDSECSGEDERCCENTNCHYKECLSIRQNIACPVPKSDAPSNRTEAKCRKDVQCEQNEKCCEWFGSKHCLKGIDIIPRPGFCPFNIPLPLQECKADFPSCFHDAECPGPQDKCCYNPGCQYHECIDMNVEFSCPTINLEKYLAQEGKSCEENVDCDGFTSLCCDLKGSKHCVSGIHNPPKEGECPALGSTENLPCMDHNEGDCEHDSECGGDKKCCDTKCGYKQCLDKPASSNNEQIDNQKKDLLVRIIKELDL